MRIVRGAGATPAADRAYTDDLVSAVASGGEAVLRVWQPPRQVAFGRRDRSREGFQAARRLVAERGLRHTVRSVGGHAVYFTGSSVAFVRATEVSDARRGLTARYEDVLERVQGALSTLGVDTYTGEPAGAFCPGTHSLTAGGKLVGVAQRVRRDVAVVGGIVLVADHEAVADVLGPVYDLLDVPFDPEATGSLARAGGPARPERVCRALESHLAPGDPDVETLRET